MGSLWLSNGSGSLLERMVIGGGGGPANIVWLFRNCCYNGKIRTQKINEYIGIKIILKTRNLVNDL